MKANQRFFSIQRLQSKVTLSDCSSDNLVANLLAEDVLYAADQGNAAGGSGKSNKEQEPEHNVTDGTEGGEIRDESGLGSGAGVDAQSTWGTDITEGGTDAGGTDFGANMGTAEDTGGIDVKAIHANNQKGDAADNNPTTDGLDEINADPDLTTDPE